MFKLNNGNSKLGAGIKVINLSRRSCRKDAPCYKLCYAGKGTFNFPNVKNCYDNNYDEYMANPLKAERDIISQLPLIGFVRIHASGDMIDMEYFKMLIRISKVAKGVKFMAYTKQYELINTYVSQGGKIPRNFKIIFSLWDGFACPNPNNFPTSTVLLKKGNNDKISKGGYVCSGNCSQCFYCWNIKKGKQVLFEQH